MEEMIRMDNIHKSYFLSSGLEIPVLKGINLTIKKGEFVALMGPSGSGKSTLLNIIGFLHASTSGEYFFEGEEVGEFRDDETLSYIRNQKCGFIFQQYYLIPRLSSMRNVMLPAVYADITKSTRNTKAESLLTQVGLSHRLQSTPSELSGGEQQRVAIARALMNTPDLLLADEPTGALDSKSGGEVMKIIQDLNKKGMTIIMVTHEEEIAAYADRTIYLRDGVVVSHDKKLSTNQPNNA